MISRLLNPLLSLHGWQAYALIGLLVFAEASIMLGFVFPGETAAILGGVLGSRGHVNIVVLVVIVVGCAIAGDSVGYLVGYRWGQHLLGTRWLRRRHRTVDRVMAQLNKRGGTAVFLARFTAFLRAVVPGLAGMSTMTYRTFLRANVAGGLVWGIAFCLLGYFVGDAYTKVEHYSGIASDILLGLLALVVIVMIVRRRRIEQAELEDPSDSPG